MRDEKSGRCHCGILLPTILIYTLIAATAATTLDEVTIDLLSSPVIEVAEGQDMEIHAAVTPSASDVIIKWNLAAGFLIDVRDNRFAALYNTTWNPRTGETKLIIKNVQLSHDGEYLLQVQINENERPSGDIKLGTKCKVVVMVPPESVAITGGNSHTVVENQDYNLTCAAEKSNPEVTIKWLDGGAEITPAVQNAVQVASDDLLRKYYRTFSTITIKPTQADTGKVYTCEVSGKQMVQTQTLQTTITVKYAPKVQISIDPSSLTQTAGEDVTYSCSADSYPTAVSWKWYMDGAEMAGQTADTFSLNNIQPDNNGKKLKCEATNGVGSGHVEHTLVVFYAPVFTKKAENVQVDLGDSVTFTCEIDGNPAPSVIWMKTGERQILATSTTYTISKVREKDIDSYVCVGSVTGFDNAEHTVHILKKDAPKISGSKEFTFAQGDTAVLSCKAECIPEPTEIIWRKGGDGDVISTAVNSRYSIHRENNVHGLTSILSIADLASNDFDDYECTIINERGSDSMVVTLSQTDDFPWLWVLVGAGAVVVLVTSITIAVCCCRRNKAKTSSADSTSSDPYWMEPPARKSPFRGDALQFYQTCSLSVVSNTTDSSTKKPADGMEQMEITSLPDYGARPIDTWRASQDHNNTHVGFDSLDYPNGDPKTELYGTFRAQPVSTSSFEPQIAYPPGNYGSYRVQHPRANMSSPSPQYSTLPLRPSMLPPNEYNRFGYNSPVHLPTDDEGFPEPPPEHRLATNV